MLIKSDSINRLLKDKPYLNDRRFGLPFIGKRLDDKNFNPAVQDIADAIDFYGFGLRDEDIVNNPDIDLGSGNPMNYKPFPLSILAMKKSLDDENMYKYPYTEGNDEIRKILLDYIKEVGFINTEPYDYEDIDESGLSIHNITFLPSTSITFNIIINTIAKRGDVIITTGPNYGLFTIRAERSGAEVEILALEKEDNYLVNPSKLADKIDEINESLQKVYNRREGYVPRVVAFVNTNPHNPTGKVMGEKEVELLTKIGTTCKERGVFVIDDLVYRDITFDKCNIAKPIATIKGMFKNTISLFGLSKSYGLASVRAGFIVADEVIIREVINRIFQEIDSSPDLIGHALAGAYNTSTIRKEEYEKYFSELRSKYVFRYNLLKALVNGINSIKDENMKNNVIKVIRENTLDELETDELLKGLLDVSLVDNLEPEAGFFALLDFSKLKGKKFNNEMIHSEEDILKFFYKTGRIRFLVGQSISWPHHNELIGRITFAIEENKIIKSLSLMHNALLKLENKKSISVRKNILADQEQMAHIKIDGWRAAYKEIVDSKYLDEMDYEAQTKRYEKSFEEFKDTVFVAIDDETKEVLGYSCFTTDSSLNADCELVSLYIKPSEKGQGIGSILFKETTNDLYNLGKKSMLVWCFMENKKTISFYKMMGGKAIGLKDAFINNKIYREVGFIFDLDKRVL